MSYLCCRRNFYTLGVFVIGIFLFGLLFSKISLADTKIIRVPDPPTVIKIPKGAVQSGSCPADLIPGANQISICGVVHTADVNTKDGIQYAQEPIKGATVAVYLGVEHIKDNPGWLKTNFASVKDKFDDPNKTGELVGLIEGLYTYTTTNVDGRFVLPVPRGKGTNGFAYLAFFCGNQFKDLYMIDTTQDLSYMPVSLACGPKVTPVTGTVQNIPAPPSVYYDNRLNYLSCEDKSKYDISEAEPGMLQDKEKSTTIPLKAAGLDDSRVGATVTQAIHYTCEYNPITGGWSITNKTKGDYVFEQGPSLGNGQFLEVPATNTVLSRRDLEGFTHSSVGYSPQAISSLNCGISGCYYTGPPATEEKASEDNGNYYLEKGEVERCNTEPFVPLNCKGPGIELGEPQEYLNSAELQKDVPIYRYGGVIKLGSIQFPYINWLYHKYKPGFSEEFFPYSTVLNYAIGKKFDIYFSNRPSNDSYKNDNGTNNICALPEEARQNPSKGGTVAEYPFNACYGSILPGEDTYSTQKATYLTTKNTERKIKDPDPPNSKVNDPVVSKFLAPGEQVGVELNYTGTYPGVAVTEIPVVGKGYWRIGNVQTLCSHGQNDYDTDKKVDYPVLAIYGAEGALRAN